MSPFLYCDPEDSVIKLLGIIVEYKISEKCKNRKELVEIDVAEEENFLSVNKIKMGFSVEDTINRKQKDPATISEINVSKEEAHRFIISMLAKLFEKSVLGTTVLRCASIFDPILQERWKQLLKHLIALGIVAPNRCDKAIKKMDSEFSGFFLKECRIDNFYFKTVDAAK